jgi:iron-sulfur cluster assembly protein
MIRVTEAAAAQIRRVLSGPEWGTHAGLRLGLRDGGCSGFFYLIDFEAKPDDDDMVIEDQGVRLFVHPLHAAYLEGSQVGWKDALVETGFVIDNPNVTRSCGCGESVEF